MPTDTPLVPSAPGASDPSLSRPVPPSAVAIHSPGRRSPRGVASALSRMARSLPSKAILLTDFRRSPAQASIDDVRVNRFRIFIVSFLRAHPDTAASPALEDAAAVCRRSAPPEPRLAAGPKSFAPLSAALARQPAELRAVRRPFDDAVRHSNTFCRFNPRLGTVLIPSRRLLK